MGDLPGFSSEDTAPLPSKAEMRALERGKKALELYYRPGGNLSKVRKELKLRSNAQAQIVLNRALQEWRKGWDDRLLGVVYMHATTLEELHRRVSHRALGSVDDGSDVDMAAVDRLMKIEERQARLHGTDAEKDEGRDGTKIFVIESRPPDERDDVIDGTYEELPKRIGP